MKIPRGLILDENETIIRLIRRSPWSYLGKYVIVIFFVGTALFFMIPLFYYGPVGVAVFSLILLLACWVFLRIVWSIFRNALVLTNKHIIDVDRRKFFRKKVSRFSLNDILKVESVMKTWRGKIFHYGNVVFRLRGVSGALVLRYVPDPDGIREMILNTRENEVSEENTGNIGEKNKVPEDEKIIKVLMKIHQSVGDEKFDSLLDRMLEQENESYADEE